MSRLLIIVAALIALHFAVSNLHHDSDIVVGICSLVILASLYIIYRIFVPALQNIIYIINKNKNAD